MWNKKRDEEFTPRPAAPPTSTHLSREGIPVSPLPARGTEPEASRGPAVIGKAVVIKGQIHSREDLYIDGEVDGTLELHEHRLTIGPNGRVQAAIKAREVIIIGTVQGNIEASDKIDIRKDAKLVGDIRTTRIAIEDGAYFKGSIDISRPEIVKPAAVPRPVASAPVAASSTPASTPQQQTLAANLVDPKR